MTKPPEKPAGVILRTNTIYNGRFIPAGEVTPYENEADLPESLKPFVAVGDETFYTQSERNDFDVFVDHRLPEETEAALRDAAERHAALGKAKLQGRQDALDNLHESLASVAEPQKFYVRRGGEWARAERARLKPAENVFSKQPNGEMWVVGIVDSEGQLPPQEIRL